MRHTLLLVPLLSNCAFVPSVYHRDTKAGWSVEPASGCIQGIYRHGRRSSFSMEELHKNGRLLSSHNNPPFLDALRDATHDYPPAYELARTSSRWWRTGMALDIAAGSLVAISIPLINVGTRLAGTDERSTHIVLAAWGITLGLGLSSGLLSAGLSPRAGNSFKQAIEIYNVHARTSGCADPDGAQQLMQTTRHIVDLANEIEKAVGDTHPR